MKLSLVGPMLRAARGPAVLVSVLLLASSVNAADIERFEVTVEGVQDSGLADSILNVSELPALKTRGVATLRALRHLVDQALPRVERLLRARAFYDSRVDYEIRGQAPPEVVLKVSLGPVYRLAAYRVLPPGSDEPEPALEFSTDVLGIAPRQPAHSEKIVDAESRIVGALARRSYPLAQVKDRRVVVDHETNSVTVTLRVDKGPYARFGATTIEGLEDVSPEVVRRHLRWTRGTPYHSDPVDVTRDKLRETGLFDSIIIQPGETVDAEGELPMKLSLTERKPRSVGAGVSYSTTEGLLGKLFWEHRNLFGGGEQFRVRAEMGEIRQGVFGDLRISDVGRLDQDVVFDARVSRETPEAFTSLETVAVARLERRFADIYSGSAGIGYDRSSVDDNISDETFNFIILPLSVRRDSSDDLLDPGSGGRTTLSYTPHAGILDTRSDFAVMRLYDSTYFSLLPNKEVVLAGWLRLGTIVGESTLDIPANKRLYAGGAGSVRGYAFNTISPLDAENDPVGGRSSTEFGAEFRWRAFDPIGLVAFVEAGGVYDDNVPEWGEDLLWGAGIGLRYLTTIGPIRLDVAFPINKREVLDDSFQILVSLGQAF